MPERIYAASDLDALCDMPWEAFCEAWQTAGAGVFVRYHAHLCVEYQRLEPPWDSNCEPQFNRWSEGAFGDDFYVECDGDVYQFAYCRPSIGSWDAGGGYNRWPRRWIELGKTDICNDNHRSWRSSETPQLPIDGGACAYD